LLQAGKPLNGGGKKWREYHNATVVQMTVDANIKIVMTVSAANRRQIRSQNK